MGLAKAYSSQFILNTLLLYIIIHTYKYLAILLLLL